MGSPEPTVLFVDDEVSLTETAAQALSTKGFVVHIANSADEAIGLVQGGLRPDILCTDIVMPGGSGVNLAKDITGIVPEVKVLLITGKDEQVSARNTRGGFAVMGKPYLFSTLARKLHELAGVAGK